MVKISDITKLPFDNGVSLDDYLVGTDVNNALKSKNYKLRSILDLFNLENGDNNSTTPYSVYELSSEKVFSEENGVLNIVNDETDLSQITSMSFSRYSKLNVDLKELFDLLDTKKETLKIRLVDQSLQQLLINVFEVTNVAPVEISTVEVGYTLTVSLFEEIEVGALSLNSEYILDFLLPTEVSKEEKDNFRFNTTLDDSVTVPDRWWENVVGMTVADFRNNFFSQNDETLLFPSVDAFVGTEASVSISGQISGTFEVGTTIFQGFTATLNKGQILNGNNSLAGPVIGDLDTVTLNAPDSSQIYQNNSASGTTDAVTGSGYELQLGTNTWTLITTNEVGTTTYTDNKGNNQTITEIENKKSDTTRDNVTFSVTAVYNRYHYLGNQNTSPTDSSNIRVLSRGSLSTSNTGSFTVGVPAGTQEFSFYNPTGKGILVIDTGNLNNDLTSAFNTTQVNVDDNGGNSVVYDKHTVFLGLGGFPQDTIFSITIL